MSKEDNELMIQHQQSLAVVPEFMKDDAGDGLGDIQKYITPPRIKVVQKQAGEAWAKFGTGSVVLAPQGFQITPKIEGVSGKPFFFVPILWFAEWATLNPYEMKGTLSMFRERTKDPNHPIAIKSRKKETRSEPCPENPSKNVRHVEFLNFVIVLLGDSEYAGLPVTLSFSKGELSAGSNFVALLTTRCGRPGGKGKPMYGCVFRGQVTYPPRKNPQGDWYGIDITNPTAEDAKNGIQPTIMDEEMYLKLKDMNKSMTAKIGDILVDHETDILEEVNSTLKESNF